LLARRHSLQAGCRAVDVDDFAAQGDGVDAADQPVGRGRLAAHANAFAAVFNGGDRRPQQS